MEIFPSIASVLIYFGSGLCFLNGLEHLARGSFYKKNYLTIANSFINGFILLGSGLLANRIPIQYPLLLSPFLTSIFLVGPFSLFVFYSNLYQERAATYRLKYHLLPALMVLVIEVVFQMQPADLKRQWLADLFREPTDHFFSPLVAVGTLHVSIYFSYLLKTDLSVWNVERISVGVRLIAINISAAIIAVILMSVAFFSKWIELFFLSGVLISLIHIFLFLSRNRDPEFFQLLRTEIKQKRYEKSLLRGINTEAISARLHELMRDKELFRNPEISLQELSGTLLISPHQLSQFLNERLSLNFRGFINTYRIEEAKRMLRDEPGRSVISICFDVGFNSISTFNTTFRKHTGVSPKEFRTRNG